MENASKALLIAGAILIAITLIGIGTLIIGQANGIFSLAGQKMDAQQIQLFNNEFEQFEGTKKGSDVKSLISKITASNATNDDNKVTVNFEGADYDVDKIATITVNIKASAAYDVVLEKDPKTAVIVKAIITKKTTP